MEIGGQQPQSGNKAAHIWLRKISKKRYEDLLNQVYATVYPSKFRDTTRACFPNEIKENHLRFIRHMDIYLVLRQAIKFGDIGLLRFALRECCIIFQAKERNTFNYGPELLRLIHLYACDEASDIQLQDAMLANSLVNLSGTRDRFFEMDRLLEYLNGCVKETMRTRRTSTKPIDELIVQIALNAPYMLKMRLAFQGYCSRHYSGKHPTKSVAEDIRIHARDLWERDFRTKDRTTRFSRWVADDLIYAGMQCIGENLSKYNLNASSRAQWYINETDLQGMETMPDEIERPMSPAEELLHEVGIEL